MLHNTFWGNGRSLSEWKKCSIKVLVEVEEALAKVGIFRSGAEALVDESLQRRSFDVTQAMYRSSSGGREKGLPTLPIEAPVGGKRQHRRRSEQVARAVRQALHKASHARRTSRRVARREAASDAAVEYRRR